ncbi:hypothetical protein A9X01_27700 [Mycobacterium asiaticum]|uniref:Uncharacterized protein n=1 Tax=Mycobacterium asiaticum TaxID=1790 RepID=A0A1A3BSZ3_MYCAS|nr:hypothetical protein A9X01_27700 [Mycobacterium asiaticum]
MAFAATALRHAKPFFAPKALHLLVIDCPAFSAGVVIRGPKPTSWAVLGVLAKPGSQGGVGILGGRRDGCVPLGCAVLPGHAAGKPFADPQHALEVTNGRPPTFRA